MPLNSYFEKRNFSTTNEPMGPGSESKPELVFVVQKHAASHLHYDFRLELNGVLKSWAIPKGPSMNPDHKRLAIMVEDHPYDYKDFEGIIPEGNYGAGKVIVWDNGTYRLADNEIINKENAEKVISTHLDEGHLSFILEGKKLKGEFSIIKLKGRKDNSWLLIKKQDKYANDLEVLDQEKSVISNLTLNQVTGPN